MLAIRKYPRTRHILDSALQPGDKDLNRAAFDAIDGRHMVVEEKLDGANCAISFDAQGNLLLQSRAHYLTGGPRERHFDLLKSWAHAQALNLRPVLKDRYIVYGEWMFAKHTIFYDRLPHYFLEFDVLDRQNDIFLSTPARRRLLKDLPFHAVPVIYDGIVGSTEKLKSMVVPARYKSADWRAVLGRTANEKPHRRELVLQQTDPSDLMEGLYIKVEADGQVLDRFEYVRHDFLSTVADSESHWQSRPILANLLCNDTPTGDM